MKRTRKRQLLQKGGEMYTPPHTLFQQCIFNNRRGAISAPGKLVTEQAMQGVGLNSSSLIQYRLSTQVKGLPPHGVQSPGPLPGLISTTQKRTVSDVLLPLSANEYSNSTVGLKPHTEDWSHPHRRSSPLSSSPGDLLLSILIRDLLSVNSQDPKR